MKAKAYIVHRAMAEPSLEWRKPSDCLSAEPLYTSPQAQRKPLTNEQIFAIGKALGARCRLGGNPNIDLDYARAIEQAHGIKERSQ